MKKAGRWPGLGNPWFIRRAVTHRGLVELPHLPVAACDAGDPEDENRRLPDPLPALAGAEKRPQRARPGALLEVRLAAAPGVARRL